MSIPDTFLKVLANNAVNALLEQKPLTVTRHVSEPRNGFPLPIKKIKPDAHGNVTQQYRPIAILEYVHEVLSGEIASRLAKQRSESRGEK